MLCRRAVGVVALMLALRNVEAAPVLREASTQPVRVAATRSAPLRPVEVVEQFVASLSTRAGVDAAAREFLRAEWERRKSTDSRGEFLPEALAVVDSDFRAALDLQSGGDRARAIEAWTRLTAHADAYVATAATFFVMHLLTNEQRSVEASVLFEGLCERVADWPQRTVAADQLAFLGAYSALETLQYDRALELLREFLDRYPEAPERMRQSAEQMLLELSRREPERLGDVHDLMHYAAREIRLGRTHPDVTGRQERAVALLDGLIEEAEDRENSQNNSGSDQGQNSRNQQNRSARRGSRPAQRSMLPSGSAGEPNLNEARRVHPGESWGKMPARQREELLQTLQTQFPSQYRALVEQYYRQLSKEPESP